jgi:CHAD domain-containing protein
LQTIILERKLEQLLEDLADREFINQLELSEEKYQIILLNLKDIRKQAAILRSVFVVFSEDHISPEVFENFTKKLGKLNDALEFRAFHLVSKSAEKTQKSLDLNAINKEIKKFKAAGPNSIKHTLKKIRNKILDQIKKDKMTTEEFHEIRKELKHYLTVTQVMLSLNRTDDLETSFKFLTELNDKLGAERDNVLKEELTSTDHEVKKLENMSEDLKQSIRDFFQGLDININ